MSTRPLLLVTLLAFAGGVQPVFPALGTSGTQPVGLMSLRVPATSNRALSLPLDPAPTHVGTIARVSKRGVVWRLDPQQVSQVHRQRGPLALRVLTGPSTGMSFRLTAARETSATLAAEEDLRRLLRAGDQFEILEADTLATVFGADGRGLQRSRNPDAADIVQLVRDGKWQSFYHDGTAWRLQGDVRRRNRNGTVLLPGQGFIFTRRATKPLELAVLGETPDDNPTHALRRGTQVLVSSPSATAFRLSDLDVRGLRPGDIAHVLVGRDWRAYTYRARKWVDERGKATASGPALAPGTAVLLTRAAPCPHRKTGS